MGTFSSSLKKKKKVKLAHVCTARKWKSQVGSPLSHVVIMEVRVVHTYKVLGTIRFNKG